MNMRVLLVTQYAAHFHYFKSIIKTLCGKGYQVELLLLKGKHNKPEYLEAIAAFKKQFESFNYGWARARSRGLWRKVLFLSRDIQNYRRYLLVQMETPHYRERIRKTLPNWLQYFSNFSLFKIFLKSNFCGNVLKTLENITPPWREIVEDIKKKEPDILIATPVNMRRGEEACDLEYLKAAGKMGLPTFVPIVSWDNLTTKGNFHVLPDLFFVWNQLQKSEAKKFHQIPDEKIKIMGAMLFDGWFSDYKPSLTREEFCRKYNLDPAKPYLLYLGSTTNIAPDESWIPLKLREMLDQAQDESLREIQIVIRPHPSNYQIYKKISKKGIWMIPEEGRLPDMPDDSQLFYDTVFYTLAAIDGVNTSAVIDAVIMGKPGMVIVTDEYKNTQGGTEYFQNLLAEGFLANVSLGSDFLEEVRKLLQGEDHKKEARGRFVRNYICPRGLNTSAGDAALEEIENFMAKK